MLYVYIHVQEDILLPQELQLCSSVPFYLSPSLVSHTPSMSDNALSSVVKGKKKITCHMQTTHNKHLLRVILYFVW